MSPDRTPFDFCLWGWMESEVYKEKVHTRNKLVTHIMNSAALLKQERQADLRRATRTVVKRVETCIEVDVWIFEHLTLNCCNNIQTAVSPHPLKIGYMFIWTYLLRIIHTTTSKSIYNSS
jgi:hypothetical protein